MTFSVALMNEGHGFSRATARALMRLKSLRENQDVRIESRRDG
jgi:hypothetical protein